MIVEDSLFVSIIFTMIAVFLVFISMSEIFK